MDKEDARIKLKDEVKKNPEGKVFVDYICSRIETDEAMTKKILGKDKTLKGCIAFVKEKARKKAKSGYCMVDDKTVFNWVEEYYGNKDYKVTQKDLKVAEESVKSGATTRFSGKVNKSMDGQLDMFTLMGGGD